MREKLYIFLAIVVIIAIIFIILPFVFIGSPLPFFSIHNNDTVEHQVAVEVLNPNNESLFKQTYKLAPKGGVSEPKSKWMVLKMSIPSQEQQEYTFVTTLDNNTTDVSKIEMGIWSTVEIDLYFYYYTESPLHIGMAAV